MREASSGAGDGTEGRIESPSLTPPGLLEGDGAGPSPAPLDAELALDVLELLTLLRPWSQHGRRVQSLAASVTLRLAAVAP